MSWNTGDYHLLTDEPGKSRNCIFNNVKWGISLTFFFCVIDCTKLLKLSPKTIQNNTLAA